MYVCIIITIIIIIIIIIKNENYAIAGALYIVTKMCVDGQRNVQG